MSEPTNAQLAQWLAKDMGYQPYRAVGEYHMIFGPDELADMEVWQKSTWQRWKASGYRDGLPDPTAPGEDFWRAWDFILSESYMIQTHSIRTGDAVLTVVCIWKSKGDLFWSAEDPDFRRALLIAYAKAIGRIKTIDLSAPGSVYKSISAAMEICEKYPDLAAELNTLRDLVEADTAFDQVIQREAEIRELRAKVERLRGASTSGPFDDCADCGRAMVWSRGRDEDQGPGSSWMCPQCVCRRMDVAERRVSDELHDYIDSYMKCEAQRDLWEAEARAAGLLFNTMKTPGWHCEGGIKQAKRDIEAARSVYLAARSRRKEQIK